MALGSAAFVVSTEKDIKQNLMQNITRIKMMRCFGKHHWLTDFYKDKRACHLQQL